MRFSSVQLGATINVLPHFSTNISFYIKWRKKILHSPVVYKWSKFCLIEKLQSFPPIVTHTWSKIKIWPKHVHILWLNPPPQFVRYSRCGLGYNTKWRSELGGGLCQDLNIWNWNFPSRIDRPGKPLYAAVRCCVEVSTQRRCCSLLDGLAASPVIAYLIN